MAYRKWTVELDGRFHVVELETKALGQRTILVDGIQQVDERKLISLGTTDSIRVGTLSGQVQIHGKIYELQFPQIDSGSEGMAQFRVSAPQTERITLEKDPAGLSLFVDTRKRAAYFMIFVGLLLAGLGVWLAVVNPNLTGNAQSMLLVAALIVLGIYLIYFSLKSALNRMTFRVAMHELSVRQGPVPWFGNRILDPDTLASLQVQMVSHRSSRSNIRTYTYKLLGLTKDSKRLTLGEYDVADDAYFIEEQIGKYLDLPMNTQMQ